MATLSKLPYVAGGYVAIGPGLGVMESPNHGSLSVAALGIDHSGHWHGPVPHTYLLSSIPIPRFPSHHATHLPLT